MKANQHLEHCHTHAFISSSELLWVYREYFQANIES